ncbi:DUF1440 domain-containing protein [Sphingomonas aracearum]|uniref:DUF1440 domain-containing protein n=2 Tax=Sphingomonas aracearum TaxID=2283317 RepID=A0A369VRJ9_9SPHN|nr:DUF1440 domain-containing protein [Sphingomonas aracearum]
MLLLLIVLGASAGILASIVMDVFQALAARPFGIPGSSETATAAAADSASKVTTGKPVTQRRRQNAGRLVHYLTGIALGILYVHTVWMDPHVAIGFGVVFGIVVSVVLDDVLVPLFGWAPWPWATPLNVHAYSLASHAVFGAVLEASRRLIWHWLF